MLVAPKKFSIPEKRQSETLVTNIFGQNTEYKSFRMTIMFYCIKNFNQKKSEKLDI